MKILESAILEHCLSSIMTRTKPILNEYRHLRDRLVWIGFYLEKVDVWKFHGTHLDDATAINEISEQTDWMMKTPTWLISFFFVNLIDFLFRHELREFFFAARTIIHLFQARWGHFDGTVDFTVRNWMERVAKHCNDASKKTRSTWSKNAAFQLTSQLMSCNNINDCRDWLFFTAKIINRKKMNRNWFTRHEKCTCTYWVAPTHMNHIFISLRSIS